MYTGLRRHTTARHRTIGSPTLHPQPPVPASRTFFWINWNPRPTVNSQDRHNLELDPSILRTYENKLRGRFMWAKTKRSHSQHCISIVLWISQCERCLYYLFFIRYPTGNLSIALQYAFIINTKLHWLNYDAMYQFSFGITAVLSVTSCVTSF